MSNEKKSWFTPIKYLTVFFGSIFLMGYIVAKTMPAKPQEKEPVVKMTVAKWSVVLRGVAKLPLEESQGIYMEIINQINAQLDTIPKKK